MGSRAISFGHRVSVEPDGNEAAPRPLRSSVEEEHIQIHCLSSAQQYKRGTITPQSQQMQQMQAIQPNPVVHIAQPSPQAVAPMPPPPVVQQVVPIVQPPIVQQDHRGSVLSSDDSASKLADQRTSVVMTGQPSYSGGPRKSEYWSDSTIDEAQQ